MSEIAKRSEMDALVNRATAIVNKAIANKGDVASLPSSHGYIKSFEDTLASTIWDSYLHEALIEVDAGRWDTADHTARSLSISSTVITLANQE